ncbi:MAG: SMC-Scp complex subunit ScpB [Candidatus Eisenbacteria bacterium]|nr:SMC-Scp complex subunit ScpB [Candidatus Eisenbacteria bacterium]MCC7141759.1 SMC-Scp complex subunit ScpB [Candidatus Eisenbacteria bacterium]
MKEAKKNGKSHSTPVASTPELERGDRIGELAESIQAGGAPSLLGVELAPEPGDDDPEALEQAQEAAENGNGAHVGVKPRPSGRRRVPTGPPPRNLEAILEAVLFATDKPITIEQMQFALPEVDPSAIEGGLRALELRYQQAEGGFRLYQIAGGYQLRTAPDLHAYVERFLVGKRRARLSRAALETLAAVAYRQPITRGELEELRGVDCGQVLHTLMERNLVAVAGRSEALGRPLLYGTTDDFLTYFGLTALADLPSLEEFQSLLGDDPLQDPEIREALVSQGMLDEETPAGDAPLLTLLMPAADDAARQGAEDDDSDRDEALMTETDEAGADAPSAVDEDWEDESVDWVEREDDASRTGSPALLEADEPVLEADEPTLETDEPTSLEADRGDPPTL